ncbi:hypothetical protein [Streptomyces cahuitamycinicus]|uniref:Uncharacterized protein n=1 Tax=Streptomyces cahuitamycinicus TaxID=2070367 RepID=A0A2N8TGU1_9ACTN|nr:hypothetical protein [Streptomyces cahuitamycinicus]PNG18233.1 hypothetical protein C1J00_32170 [Streptomyces cahuitamycinicus]
MRLMITSQKTDRLDRWQWVFEDWPDVICQRGLRAQTPIDAVLMAAVEEWNAHHAERQISDENDKVIAGRTERCGRFALANSCPSRESGGRRLGRSARTGAVATDADGT